MNSKSKMWNNPQAKGLLVGRKTHGVVWMPSVYEEKRYPFRPIQIRFLHAYSSGTPISDICAQLEITPEFAEKLLKKKKCKEYLAELQTMDAELIARSSKQRVAHEILDVWDGKTQKSREQMEAGKAWWNRVWPQENKSSGSGEKLQININLGKVEEAFKRQAAMEAEVIRETA